MKQRQFKSHEHTQGLAAKTSNAQVSMVMSPMQNTDINETEASGEGDINKINWEPMITAYKKKERYYLNNYGTDASFCQKKPDGTWLKKGVA